MYPLLKRSFAFEPAICSITVLAQLDWRCDYIISQAIKNKEGRYILMAFVLLTRNQFLLILTWTR